MGLNSYFPKISPIIPYALAWNLKYHAMLFFDAQR